MPASHVGSGTGKIWLDDVQCTGSEEQLTDCSHRAWGKSNCVHMEDVGVKCGERDPGKGDILSSRSCCISLWGAKVEFNFLIHCIKIFSNIRNSLYNIRNSFFNIKTEFLILEMNS